MSTVHEVQKFRVALGPEKLHATLVPVELHSVLQKREQFRATLNPAQLTAVIQTRIRLNAILDEGIPVSGTPGLPRQIYDEGIPLPIRSGIDMRGAGVTATDDGAHDKTIITIPGAAAAAVTSVFTRTGAITAQAGDYTAAQVTNAVSTAGSYPDPVWIPSYAYSKLTGAPSSFPPSAHVHAAADVTSGVFAVARLGTGTPTSSVYLRGDGQWATVPIPADAVTSVFGRAGVVVAQSGDYAVAQVTGAVPDTRTIIAGSGLSGGGALSGNVTLSANIAGIQTPWLSDHNAAGFVLTNASRIDSPLHRSAADMVFQAGTGNPEKVRIYASTRNVRLAGSIEMYPAENYMGNLTYDGTDLRYISSASAFAINVVSGSCNLFTAPAGTAGAVASLANRTSWADDGWVRFPTSHVEVITVSDTQLQVKTTGSIQSAIVTLITQQGAGNDAWYMVSAGTAVGGSGLRFAHSNPFGTPLLEMTAASAIKMWLGGSLKTLTVDGSGYVKAA